MQTCVWFFALFLKQNEVVYLFMFVFVIMAFQVLFFLYSLFSVFVFVSVLFILQQITAIELSTITTFFFCFQYKHFLIFLFSVIYFTTTALFVYFFLIRGCMYVCVCVYVCIFCLLPFDIFSTLTSLFTHTF